MWPTSIAVEFGRSLYPKKSIWYGLGTTLSAERVKKGELTGRAVLCPRAQWPEEPCDGDAGWRGVVAYEKYGTTAAVRIKGILYHFAISTVLTWQPLK